MSEAARSDHLSIGEVLALVQEDFPDVTISKIRFLESQGLIAPERTGAGFRKFYDSDIERLRWILRQQGDHFLPLKVIKRMLEDGADPSAGVQTQPTLWSSTEDDEDQSATGDRGGNLESGGSSEDRSLDPAGESSDRTDRYRSPAHPAVASSPHPRGSNSGASTSPAAQQPTRPSTQWSTQPLAASSSQNEGPTAGSKAANDAAADGAPIDDSGGSPSSGKGKAASSGGGTAPRTLATPADVVAALQEDPRPGKRGESQRGTSRTSSVPPSKDVTEPAESMDMNSTEPSGQIRTPLTKAELCELCGVSSDLVDALEQFGFISSTSLGGAHVYDEGAVAVTRMAARYAELGIEPRHLRMYKIAAEREAGMIEQLVVPLLKQRNPTARQNAAERSDELASMGAELHSMFLSHQLRRILGG